MKKFVMAAMGACAVATPVWAEDASSLSATTGVDYSSGDYGTGVDTYILIVPLSLRYKTGDIRLTATLPWLRIDGSSAIVGDGKGGVVIDPNAPRSIRSGFGDLSLGAAYTVPQDKLGFGLQFSGRVKIPTASKTRRLGTGKVDFAVGAEVSKTFGPVTPFVGVGYRMPGDPTGIDLHNAWNASAGASIALGKAVLIASYDYREATSDLSANSQEIFGALSMPMGDRLSFTLYGTGGLSDGAPDYGVGGLMSIKF